MSKQDQIDKALLTLFNLKAEQGAFSKADVLDLMHKSYILGLSEGMKTSDLGEELT